MKGGFIEGLKVFQLIFMLSYEVDLTLTKPLYI